MDLKLSLKLTKTIIINISHKSSENRNPSLFRVMWAWEMGHSRMSSGFQVADHTKVMMLCASQRCPGKMVGGEASGALRVFKAQ